MAYVMGLMTVTSYEPRLFSGEFVIYEIIEPNLKEWQWMISCQLIYRKRKISFSESHETTFYSSLIHAILIIQIHFLIEITIVVIRHIIIISSLAHRDITLGSSANTLNRYILHRRLRRHRIRLNRYAVINNLPLTSIHTFEDGVQFYAVDSLHNCTDIPHDFLHLSDTTTTSREVWTIQLFPPYVANEIFSYDVRRHVVL